MIFAVTITQRRAMLLDGVINTRMCSAFVSRNQSQALSETAGARYTRHAHMTTDVMSPIVHQCGPTGSASQNRLLLSLAKLLLVSPEHAAWAGIWPLLKQGPARCRVGCAWLSSLQPCAPSAAWGIRVSRLHAA